MANNNILAPVKELERKLKLAMPGVPKIIGNEALNFALDNFRRQGFQGSTFQKWKQRKDPNKWGAVARPGRSLLVDTGRLKRSGHIKALSGDKVTLEWAVPYAKTHNKGISGIYQVHQVKEFTTKKGVKVSAHHRVIHQKIPKRQFIGDSPYLRQRAIRELSLYLKKTLK